MQNTKIGYIYVFLAASFFAIIGVLGKNVINMGISALNLIILQYAATVLLMFIYFVFKDITLLKLTRGQLKSMVIQGILGSSGTTLFYYLSLEYLNAGIASMLLFTHPILINIYFLLSKTKKINIINNIALLLAVMGSSMVINIFAFDIALTPALGIVLGLLASASYAFFNVYAEVGLKDTNPMVSTFYCSIIIMLVAMLVNPGFFKFDFVVTANSMLYIIELAVIAGVLPVVFIYKGIAIIGADKASIIATAELPVTLILAYLVLGEKMVLLQIFGIVFIIASIIILQSENNILTRVRGFRKE